MPDKKPKTFGYREEVLQALLKLLGPYDDITRDNMFGFPAFRASGQIFACVYENGISLKMPKAAAEAIVQTSGISPFIPFGRARMRQWVHIERKKPSAYIKDFPLIEASIHYVRTLKPKKSAGKAAKATPPAKKSASSASKSAEVARAKPAAKALAKAGTKKPAIQNKSTAAPKKKAAKAPSRAKSRAASPAKKAAKKSSAKKAAPRKKVAKKAAPSARKASKKKSARKAGKSVAKRRK